MRQPATKVSPGPKGWVALAGILVLTGCQNTPPSADYLAYKSPQDADITAGRIAENVRACWFDGSRPTFAAYSYAPELNSHSNRPRVLIVPKDDPGGLPKLIIEASASGGGANVKLFGPLMATAEAPAISRDVAAWAGGRTGC